MKQNNFFKLLNLVLFLTISIALGQATLPYTNQFTGTVGTALTAQTNWSSLNSGDDINLIDNSLSQFNVLLSSKGGKISFAGTGKEAMLEFTEQTSGIVYYSFLLKVNDVTGVTKSTGGYAAGLAANTSTYGATLWFKRDVMDTDQYTLGLNRRTSTGDTSFTTDKYNEGDVLLIVAAYDLVNDSAKMWINPSNADLKATTEPATSTLSVTAGGTALTKINRFFFRQDSNTETPNLDIDELRVGLSWADVTPTSIEWVGTTDSFNTASNWNPATTPTGADDLYIPAGTPTEPLITGAETVNSITIESGATLKISGAGSLTGEVIYNRTLTANWHLVASPVNTMTVSDFLTSHTLATGSGSNLALAPYDNSQADANNRWVYYQDGYSGGDMFDVAKGFSTKLASAGDITFVGTARSGDQTSAALTMGSPTGTDFNLLGNPFLAAINSKTLADDAANTGIDNKTFWIWNGTTYDTYNDGSTTDIAPGQGFFIKAASTTAVSFKEANQLTSDGSFQKQNNTSVTLMLSEGTNKRNTKVLYIADKTTGADYGYDSEIFSEGSFALYSQLLSDDQGKKLAIQTLPNDNYEDMVVPLGLKADAGKELVFSADAVNLPSGVNVYLEDRANNVFTNLSEGNYKVTLDAAANGIGQFYLHTSSKVLSADSLTQNLDNVSIYKSAANSLTISGLQTERATINVFSVLGKKVFSTSFASNGVKTVDLPQLSTGIYIVNVNSTLGKVSKKVVIE